MHNSHWWPSFFNDTFTLFSRLRFLSTFDVFFSRHNSTRKHNKTLSCSLFGVLVVLLLILTPLEAVVIILGQVVDVAAHGSTFIKVICHDTDVFILLIHYYQQCSLTCIVLMEGRGTCLRRPLGTRRPPRHFEKLESYCIKLTSLITRYSVLINCSKEKNCKICRRKDLQTKI